MPAWVRGDDRSVPRTVQDFGFRSSRLMSLRTRNAAAYKGLYALILAHGARDWMYDQAFDKVQYANLAVDIHHVFPYKWCIDNGVELATRESIVNKTPLAAATNRAIGGAAPDSYMTTIERRAGIGSDLLDKLLATHGVDALALRRNDLETFFAHRMAHLLALVEAATGSAAVLPDLEDAEESDA